MKNISTEVYQTFIQQIGWAYSPVKDVLWSKIGMNLGMNHYYQVRQMLIKEQVCHLQKKT